VIGCLGGTIRPSLSLRSHPLLEACQIESRDAGSVIPTCGRVFVSFSLCIWPSGCCHAVIKCRLRLRIPSTYEGSRIVVPIRRMSTPRIISLARTFVSLAAAITKRKSALRKREIIYRPVDSPFFFSLFYDIIRYNHDNLATEGYSPPRGICRLY
jgi:hypothetical protein